MAKQDWAKIVNFLAFVSVILIGVLLFFTGVLSLSGEIFDTLGKLTIALAYFTVAVCGFFYAYARWGKKQIWYMIAWVIAVVLIILSYINF